MTGGPWGDCIRSGFASCPPHLLNSRVSNASVTRALRRAYLLMHDRFGHQHWWPGETPFEVCVGAILTQNTNWSNVERAITHLKSARVLEPERLFALPEAELAGLIRPAGYFNVKARRLRAFLRVLVEAFDGDLHRMFSGETPSVRHRLLAINGIGPETADSMLLYAGGHQSFVIDAYTRRIFERHGWQGGATENRKPRPDVDGPFSYHALRTLCQKALKEKRGPVQLDYWQDYHAQLVMVGKHYCRPSDPRCDECPLRPLLPRR
jgi:endonuclease-3 related protein